jgi:hypothetical protein
VFTIVGAVAPDPVPAGGIERTSRQITVAGSGVPSSAPSRLVEGSLIPTGIDPFEANTVVFDPTSRLHVAAGADRLANLVATIDEAGLPFVSPFLVAAAPGVMPLPKIADIDVAYSAELAPTAPRGAVMVAWSEGQQIYAQTLSGLTMGSARNHVGNGDSPRVVYSQASREFLIAWIDFGVSTYRHLMRRVALNGQPVGPIIELADTSESQAQQFDLTWNPLTNEYGVFYVHSPFLRSTLDFARIAADGTILTKTEVARALRADQLSVAVNSRTGEYILLWWDIDGTFAAEMSASGRVISLGRIDTSPVAVDYTSLAFNPVSGTFLTTGRSITGRLQLRELNQYGAPLSAPTKSSQLISGVISSPPAVSDWRVFGQFNPAGNSNVFNFGSETIGTSSSAGGSQARLGGCVLPDPFIAFGGGVCYDGGWLPPGVPAPGTTVKYSGSCLTPDPFTALGGGSCVNGGWFPPGLFPPSGAPPESPPTPGPGGCLTPDPFVALGGGTCVLGGWYPPSATAPPPPPPVSGGCTTPDPFVALGGGTCVNGGWYPPSVAAPPPPPVPGGCITPDPFVALGGGTCVNGGWYPPGSTSTSTVSIAASSMHAGIRETRFRLGTLSAIYREVDSPRS